MKMKEGKKLQIPTTVVYQEGREPREMAELSAVNELIAMYEYSQDQLRVICSSCPEHCEVIGSVAGTAQNYIGELEQKLAEAQALLRDIRQCNANEVWPVLKEIDEHLSACVDPKQP